MCNLSQGIVEKGLAEGLAKGMAQGVAEGMAKGMEQGLAKGMEQGMAKGIFDANMGSIRAMVSELHLTVEQAMNVLKIPQNERERYKAALDAQVRKPRLWLHKIPFQPSADVARSASAGFVCFDRLGMA